MMRPSEARLTSLTVLHALLASTLLLVGCGGKAESGSSSGQDAARLDRAYVSGECGQQNTCEAGLFCYDLRGFDRSLPPAVCVRTNDPCSIVRCDEGRVCGVTLDSPAAAICL